MTLAVLQLILKGEIDVNDFVLWLCDKLPENKTYVKLLCLDKIRGDFIPFLLSYIREETLIHVQETRHSGITPRKSLENKLEQRNQRKSSPEESAKGRLEFGSIVSSPPKSSYPPVQGFRPRNDARTPIRTKNQFKTSPFERKSDQKLNLGQFIFCNTVSKGKNNERTQRDGRSHTHRENQESVLDFKDDSAFPPVGTKATKKNKQPLVTRRITPTPVSQRCGKLPGSVATVTFVSNESTSAPFENATPNESPVSYEAERELLRQERAKRRSEICHVDNTDADNSPISSFESSSDFSSAVDTSPDVVTLSLEDVTCKHELDLLSELYAAFIRANLIPSLSVELHFLVQLITVRGKPRTSEDDDSNTNEDSYFNNAANCVHFALNVLWQQRQLLLFLDKNTLRLLIENPRVESFASNLWLFLKDACEVATSVSQYGVAFPFSKIGMVAYQYDTDNKNNFISEHGFHLFRKKRDLFYEIFRDWDSNRLNPNYINYALSKRIQALVYVENDSTTFAHLARLFQSQLIVTCKGDGFVDDGGDSLDPEPLETLKRSNPEKYKRLADRFVSCKQRFGGPSPKPSFPGHQEFFKSFITIAGSHSFNQHLVDCLSTQIIELNNVQFNFSDNDEENESEMDFDDRDEFISCLLTLRLLAKFLGFVVFLPYRDKDVMSEDLTVTQAALRQETCPIIDIYGYVNRAVRFRRIVLTIPWIVEFLSMMDQVAPSLRYYRKVLNTLHCFYKSCTLDFNDSSINFNHFLVLNVLGWLFQVINYVQMCDTDLNVNFTDEKVDDTKYESLDSIPLIDQQTLYICCPYLADLRVLLSEFVCGMGERSGTMRKITPLSMSSSSTTSVSTISLQVQLEENFFHNHPVSLKRTVEFVADRISSNIIKHVRKVILPSVRNRASFQIKELSSSVTDLGFVESLSIETKCEAAKKARDISLTAATEAESETLCFAKELCPNHAETVFRLLLPEDALSSVVEVCVKIVKRIALKKVSQWFTTNVVADVYEKELVSELQKHLGLASENKIEKPSYETAKIASVHDDTAPSPAFVVRSVKNLLKTLYDISKVPSITSEEATNAVISIVTVLTHRSDVTNMIVRTLIQQSVDFAMALVIRCPEILTAEMQDKFLHLWTSNREISIHFLELILCPRNIHYLKNSNCSEANWTKLNDLIEKLLHSELVIKDSVIEQINQVIEMKWPQETIERLEKFHRFLVDF